MLCCLQNSDGTGSVSGRMFESLKLFAVKAETEELFWPNSNENGYAFYHRVDKVNGGDENATHTSGFGKKTRFWYK